MISVIIPLYNAEQYIKETLYSLISQSYKEWECLIVDDGSSDNSLILAQEISKEEKRITVQKRPSFVSKGPSAIRNYGIEISKAEFINFLDADDIIHKDKFKILIEKLKQNSTKIACISKSFHFEETPKNLTRPWKKGIINKQILDSFAQSKSGWQTGDPLWRREHLPKKMFDERLFGPDDWIAHISLLLQYNFEDFIFIDNVLSYIRVLPISLHSEPSERRLKSDVLSRELVLNWFKNIDISKETINKLNSDLLKSSEEALKHGYLKIGIHALKITTIKQLNLGNFIRFLIVWCIGIPSMYFFKKGYQFFRF